MAHCIRPRGCALPWWRRSRCSTPAPAFSGPRPRACSGGLRSVTSTWAAPLVWTSMPCSPRSKPMTPGTGSSACKKRCSGCICRRMRWWAVCRRHPQARGLGASPGRSPGCVAAGRADQPPGPGGDRMARRPAAGLFRQRGHHHPRPLVPGPRCHAHRRTRPGATALLPGQLCAVPAPQGRATGAGGRQRGQGRQALGARGGLDTARRAGAPEPPPKPAPPPGAGGGGGGRGGGAGGGYEGKMVGELTGVGKSFGAKTIVRDFSSTILRGDKVGLTGPNGAGKTSLLKMILGELPPDQGRVRQGANLQVAYFDQLRETIALDATLEDFISPGSEWIEIGQQRKHVRSYLGDFLFSPARARSPVRSLSGGERSRLLLARLFARPANVLVLDEPTNDLDMDTLELLEELLENYAGTGFLVSHDRTFLDNVVGSIIGFEGDGRGRESAGGVQDGLLQAGGSRAAGAAAVAARPAAMATTATAATTATTPAPQRAKMPVQPAKLSYKEQRALEQLPAQITALETEQQGLQRALADGLLFRTHPAAAVALTSRVAAIDEELMAALERWTALSDGQRR